MIVMRRSVLFMGLLYFLSVSPVWSQDVTPDEAFAWSVSGPEKTLRPGDRAEIIATLNIAKDHYVYRDSVSVEIPAPSGIQVNPAVYPEPKVKFDKFENKDLPIYEAGEVNIRVPIIVTEAAPSGDVPLEVVAKHRGCSQEVCYFPTTENLPLNVNITGGEGTVAATAPGEGFVSLDSAPAAGGDLLSRGLLQAFILVFIGGILTSFTPCVYPLIPVTIAIFGARDATKLKAFTLSLTYVAGICLMYSVLGLIAASTGAVFGSVMANPIVVGIVMVVLILLAFSMFGLFDFRVPVSVQNRLSSVGGHGYTGAFMMGLVAGIIAAPCTGPVLGSVLLFVAATQNLFLGFWLLFTFALGIGVLFIVLGTFSGALAHLPRSGGWMEGVKHFFGIVLIAMALYFGKNAFPWLGEILLPLPTGLIAGLTLIVLSLPMGSIHRSFKKGSGAARALKVIGVVVAIVGVYYTAGAFTVTEKGPIDWIYDEQTGLAKAEEEGEPVIIDVWADWCQACKELDHTTFRDPRVVERLGGFVTIKFDFTRETEERKRLKEKYNIPGLPVLLFYNSDGEYLPDAKLIGYQTPDQLLGPFCCFITPMESTSPTQN